MHFERPNVYGLTLTQPLDRILYKAEIPVGLREVRRPREAVRGSQISQRPGSAKGALVMVMIGTELPPGTQAFSFPPLTPPANRNNSASGAPNSIS